MTRKMAIATHVKPVYMEHTVIRIAPLDVEIMCVTRLMDIALCVMMTARDSTV